MPILKTIQTSTEQLYDTNGVKGFGRVVVTPNKSFEYDDGVSTISVSNSSTVVAVADGLLASTFQLHPNTGASNDPDETWYEVVLELNNTRRVIYWQIASGAASTLEFNDVTELPAGTSSDSVTTHEAATNPHSQYILRSDAVDSATAGTGSDGVGYVVRAGSDGKIDPAFIDDVGGASAANVSITDSGAYYTGTDVEAALQEAAQASTTKITDAGGYYTGTDVEAALQEGGATFDKANNSLQNISNNGVVANYAASYNPGTSFGDAVTLTVPSTGFYLVTWSANCSLGTSGGSLLDHDLELRLNGPAFSASSRTWFVRGYNTELMETAASYTQIIDVTSISTPTLALQAKDSGTTVTLSDISLSIIRVGDT